MTLSLFFAIALGIILIIFGGISFVASRRQNRNYEKLARTTTFHCLHCDSIYTSRESKDIENCPACGYKNPRLKF